MSAAPVPIHTSDRILFKQCRLAWHFASPIRLNLEPLHKAKALTFGTAMHRGLESYYDPSTPRESIPAITAFVENVNEWYAKVPSSVEADEEYQEAMTLGPGMLEHYFKWAKAKDNFEVIWVEKEYQVPIGEFNGVEVIYSFKPDGLVQDGHGRYWLLEDKTTAKFDDTYEFLLRDDQCGSYLWGIWLADGIKIEGIIYNELLKAIPTIPKVNKNGMLSMDKRIKTTYQAYKQAIIDHHGSETMIPLYEDFLNEHLKGKDNPFFHREPVRRNHREILAVGEGIKLEVMDMVSDPSIYRRPDRFNCGRCQFQTPCLVYYEGGDLEATLRNQYQERDSK